MNSSCANNSSIDDDDPYDVDAILDCFTLRLIGIYLVILFFASLVLNLFHFWIYYKTKILLNPLNAFINTLVGSNLFATLSELPMVIHSTFNCRFIFGKIGCTIQGFLMYSVGCMSIYLLTAISLERHYILFSPNSFRIINFRTSVITIAACALLGIFWAGIPISGHLSHYSLEGAKISCSVEWDSRETDVVAYNIAIFTFVFAAPVLVIIITNVLIILKFRQKRTSSIYTSNVNASQVRNKIQKQRNITKMTIWSTTCFLLSWSPYAIISIYRAFIATTPVNPLLATLPGLLAKSSLVWVALINVLINRAFKSYLPWSSISRSPY